MTIQLTHRNILKADTNDDQITLAIEEIRRFRREIRRQEFEQAMKSLDLDPKQAHAISLLSYRLVRRLTETQVQELEQSDNQELGAVAMSLYTSNSDRSE